MTPLVDLTGKRGLIVGIANKQSIAAGCAQAFRQCGATLAATYLNEKARGWVEPVTKELDIDWTMPCDVREPGQLEELKGAVERHVARFAFREDGLSYHWEDVAPREPGASE